MTGRRFDGTVLDIMFQGEADGGMRLWEQMDDAGLTAPAGDLLVATKDNRPAIGVFADKYAGGRLCTSYAAEHREGALRDFLNGIRRRKSAAAGLPIRPGFVSKPRWDALGVDAQLVIAAVVGHFEGRLEKLEAQSRRKT